MTVVLQGRLTVALLPLLLIRSNTLLRASIRRRFCHHKKVARLPPAIQIVQKAMEMEVRSEVEEAEVWLSVIFLARARLTMLQVEDRARTATCSMP